MYVGTGYLCYGVSDLERSIRLYQALGLEVVGNSVPGQRTSAVLRRGHFSVFLIGWEGSTDCINFRGADAFAVRDYLRRQGLELPGEPQHGTDPETSDPSTAWMTADPDGHAIFFNTHAWEITPEHRADTVRQILHRTESELLDWGASDECLRAYREFLAKFGSA
jgi:catechol 2,3-dioxygenase-like lactoylglutathione lyase family enzyme